MHLGGSSSENFDRPTPSVEGGLETPKAWHAAATTSVVPNSLATRSLCPVLVGLVYHGNLRIGSGAQTRFGGGLQLRTSHLRAEGLGQGLWWPLAAGFFRILLVEHLAEDPEGRIPVALTASVDVASKKAATEEATGRSTGLQLDDYTQGGFRLPRPQRLLRADLHWPTC